MPFQMVSVNARAHLGCWSGKRAGCRGKSMAPAPARRRRLGARERAALARARVAIRMLVRLGASGGTGWSARGDSTAPIVPCVAEIRLHSRPILCAAPGRARDCPRAARIRSVLCTVPSFLHYQGLHLCQPANLSTPSQAFHFSGDRSVDTRPAIPYNPPIDDALPPTQTAEGWRVSGALHHLTVGKWPAKKPGKKRRSFRTPEG